MFQDEADEDVVEGLGVKGQLEDVRLPELNVRYAGSVGPSLGFGDRVCRYVDRRETSLRASLGQRDRLGAHATASLEHRASAGVCSVEVQ